MFVKDEDRGNQNESPPDVRGACPTAEPSPESSVVPEPPRTSGTIRTALRARLTDEHLLMAARRFSTNGRCSGYICDLSRLDPPSGTANSLRRGPEPMIWETPFVLQGYEDNADEHEEQGEKPAR